MTSVAEFMKWAQGLRIPRLSAGQGAAAKGVPGLSATGQLLGLDGSGAAALEIRDGARITVLGGEAIPNPNKVVDGDWTLAVQEAANRPEPLLIPRYRDGAGAEIIPRISAPILVSQPYKQTIIRGRVEALPAFAGAVDGSDGKAMFWTNNVGGGYRGVKFEGEGTIDCMGYADRAIYMKFVVAAKVRDLHIAGAKLVPVHVGAATAGANSYEVTISGLDIANIKGGDTQQNDANSIGVYMENCADSTIRDTVILGYRRGVKTDKASIVHENVHPWTTRGYGSMLAGFHSLGDANTYAHCYSDTPATLGLISGYVYGYLLEGYQPTLSHCRVFLLSKNGAGTDVSTDLECYGVYVNRPDGGFITMFQFRATSNDAAKRYKDVLGGSSLTNVAKTATILGGRHDGRWETYSAVDRFQGNTTTNTKWTTSPDRGNANFHIAPDANRVQMVESPLTANRTATLPTEAEHPGEIYRGIAFRVCRAVTSTGAFDLTVSWDGTVLGTLGPGEYADFAVNENLQFRCVGGGPMAP